MSRFQKLITGTLLSAALLVSAAASAAFADSTTHDDVYTQADHKAFMAGYDDGSFGALDAMTRAQAAQIIFNLINDGSSQYLNAAPTFTDVTDSGKYYYYPVGYLQSVGILSGYGDGLFKPDQNVTRTELLAMLDKYLDTGADGVCSFSDVQTDHWGYRFIRNAAASGWVTGESGTGGIFRPDDDITRAEATAIFVQALERNDSYAPDAGTGVTFSDVNAGNWYYALVREATNGHTVSDNVFAGIFTRYNRAVSSNYTIYDCNTVSSGLLATNSDEKSNVYYAYIDINGDGRTELVIAGGSDSRKAIFDIYTYDANRQAVRLIPDFVFAFGERANVVIEADGTLAVSWSNSAFNSGRDYYTISNDGILVLNESIWLESDTVGNIKYYGIDGNGIQSEISEADYNTIRDSYPVSADHQRGVDDLNWVSIHQTQEFASMEAAYTSVIRDLTDRYGVGVIAPTMIDDGNWMTGLAVVRLVDFDGDGTPELLVAYQNTAGQYANRQAVYGYDNGYLVTLMADRPVNNFGTDVSPSITLLEKNNVIYLMDAHELAGDYLTLENGAFVSKIHFDYQRSLLNGAYVSADTLRAAVDTFEAGGTKTVLSIYAPEAGTLTDTQDTIARLA